MIDPTGIFEVGDLAMEVVPDGGGWKVVLPGVPEGFEPGLSRVDDAQWSADRTAVPC